MNNNELKEIFEELQKSIKIIFNQVEGGNLPAASFGLGKMHTFLAQIREKL